MNIWIILAGLNAALAVAMGAYGWHHLGGIPEVRDVYMMGSQYQMWHALALLGVALLGRPGGPPRDHRLLGAAGACFQAGIILFCGTLYAFGLVNIVPVSGAAPVGGGLLILGWLLVAATGVRTPGAGQRGS